VSNFTMRLRVVIIMLAGLTGSALAQQPGRPDFSGHWILETAPPPLEGRPPICAAECRLSQTEGELAVSDGMHDRAFKLNGVPALAIATTTEITAKISTTAAWEGTTLAISETVDSAQLNGGKPFTTTARISLSDGRLTIEGIRSTNAGAVDKYRAVYRKAS